MGSCGLDGMHCKVKVLDSNLAVWTVEESHGTEEVVDGCYDGVLNDKDTPFEPALSSPTVSDIPTAFAFASCHRTSDIYSEFSCNPLGKSFWPQCRIDLPHVFVLVKSQVSSACMVLALRVSRLEPTPWLSSHQVRRNDLRPPHTSQDFKLASGVQQSRGYYQVRLIGSYCSHLY
jgi:hypothetical protein